MARLGLLIILLYSCSSFNKGSDKVMTVDMRNEAFSYQNYIAELTSTNDPLFIGMKSLTCNNNWLDSVTDISKKLKLLKTDSQRSPLWQQLATCYYFAGKSKHALYYYDLALGQEKNSKRKSVIHSNAGQIYLDTGNESFANASFYTALELDSSNLLANYHLMIYALNLTDQVSFNKHINRLSKRYPKSRTLHFIRGLNFFLLNDSKSLTNKVLRLLDDQSVEKNLLKAAIGVKRKDKAAIDEIESLDLKLKLHRNFRDYVLKNYGK